MSKLSGVKGMNDILPEDVGAWQRIESAVRARFSRYGYRELRTPVVEETALFARSIGEATDIVGKEMYTFTDRKGKKSLSLRPEGTAGAVRAYIEHAVYQKEPVAKWWYQGPMYRYERVQAGRYRQFHQIGAEAFGVADPGLDAELIVMLDGLLRHDLALPGVVLNLNSLGDAESRPRYLEALVAHLQGHLDILCEDCRRRLELNPLRTLDCKVPTCQPVLDAAPSLGDYLSDAAKAHFDEVLRLLDAMDVPYVAEAPPGPGPRLLQPHLLRVRRRGPRLPERRGRGRALRRAGEDPRRAADPGHRLRHGGGAPGALPGRGGGGPRAAPTSSWSPPAMKLFSRSSVWWRRCGRRVSRPSSTRDVGA